MEQFNKIKEFVPPSNSFYIPIVVAFYSGFRRSEVWGLKWEDVSFENHTLSVNRNMIQLEKRKNSIDTPKTQSSYRIISVGDTLIKILKNKQKRRKENGKPITPNSIKWNVSQLRKKSSVEFDFHSFKRTHASLLFDNGAIPKSIQERLGHSRVTTTMDTYVHLTKKMSLENVDILERITST